MRAYPGFGQDGGTPYTTAHYEIHGGEEGDAEKIAADLEGRFDIFTRLFRFEDRFKAQSNEPMIPLKVRLIPDRGAYDEYIAGRLGEKREGAVYIHYRREDRRELVVNYNPAQAEGPPLPALPYQAFIQYLRAFVPQPPSWIKSGFAVYFSGLSFSVTGEINYRENLSWLEAVRAAPIPPVRAVLLADAAEGGFPGAELSGTNFDALSWSLSSFFLNSGNEDYFRTLLECFMLLSPDAGAAENSLVLARRIGEWNGFENLDRDYRAYIDSRRTFSELMDQGRQAYLSGKDARPVFLKALDARPESHTPYYYLGLLAYGEGNWGEAERYYLQSLERGAGEAQIYYALGLNAAASLQTAKAAEYLNKAAETGNYREKAERVLRLLPGPG
jgi:tetratricopeptide (TPR) repeat protein